MGHAARVRPLPCFSGDEIERASALPLARACSFSGDESERLPHPSARAFPFSGDETMSAARRFCLTRACACVVRLTPTSTDFSTFVPADFVTGEMGRE